MATLHFTNGANDVRVFTPISTALSNLPNSGGTIVAMVKRPTVGAAGSDYAGLMNSAGTNWYHTISTGLGGGGQKLGDDDGLIGPVQITAGAQNDTANWHFFAVTWPTGGAALDRFHYNIVGGAWTHENSSANNGGNRAGPGTTGWMRLGSCLDSFTDTFELGLVAVWNVQLADGDFGTWAKTSDLWNHSAGRPIFLVEGTSLTPVDLTGGSTYSAANSSAAFLTLTGSTPSPWTFDQLGSSAPGGGNQLSPAKSGPRGPWAFSKAFESAIVAVPATPVSLVVTSQSLPPIPQILIRRGADGALQVTPLAPRLVTAPTPTIPGQKIIQRGGDNAPQIAPRPVVVSAVSPSSPGQAIVQQAAAATSAQVEASGTTGIIFGSTAIPTVSASGETDIIFNATAVPTESAIGTSTIIFNSTGAGTTPGGVSTFMAMRGANSAFVNVASATTDAAFTGGIIPAAKAGQCVNVLAVTFNADTAADTLVFNSKGAGAGTAISALFSNPINGSVVWPYTPVGWFTTNGGEALTVTTTGASPTHVQVIFEYINA